MNFQLKQLIKELDILVGNFYNCGLDYSAKSLENILRRYKL